MFGVGDLEVTGPRHPVGCEAVVVMTEQLCLVQREPAGGGAVGIGGVHAQPSNAAPSASRSSGAELSESLDMWNIVEKTTAPMGAVGVAVFEGDGVSFVMMPRVMSASRRVAKTGGCRCSGSAGGSSSGVKVNARAPASAGLWSMNASGTAASDPGPTSAVTAELEARINPKKERLPISKSKNAARRFCLECGSEEVGGGASVASPSG